MTNRAADLLVEVLLAQRREHRADQLKAASTEVLAKAAVADGLDRQLAAGYRDRAARQSRDAATLTEGNQP